MSGPSVLRTIANDTTMLAALFEAKIRAGHDVALIVAVSPIQVDVKRARGRKRGRNVGTELSATIR